MPGIAPPTTCCSVAARVVECAPICREHVWVEVALPVFPESDPGQFLQLLCRDAQEERPALRDWPADGFPSVDANRLLARQTFLRRPFSIADRYTARDGGVHLCVLSRRVGAGTRWLEQLRPGDTLNVTGPLGHGFRVPDHEVPLVLVGGGVGIPPLLYFARRLNELERRNVVLLVGATTRDLLPLRLHSEPARDGTPTLCVNLPGDAPFPAAVASDDGSVGLQGLVTDALQRWHGRRLDDRPAAVFACGPEGMLTTVVRLTRELGMSCQLCLERHMGCGLGTCLSCVVRVRDPACAAGWRWALTCTDGPVFERDTLLDDGAGRRA